jgi:hypothetical protein
MVKQDVMRRPPIPDAMVRDRVEKFGPGTPELNMFVHARQFHSGGHKVLTFETVEGGGRTFDLPPGIICYAFAAELYLKVLHQICYGRAPKGHKLHILHSNLPTILRDKITESYNKKMPKGDLNKELILFSSAFEDWRYVYETGDDIVLPVGSLVNFTITLHGLIKLERPAWPFPANDILDGPPNLLLA